MELHTDSLLKGFVSYVEAKRSMALHLKLAYLSATMIVISVLYFAFGIVKHSQDKIMIVDTGGKLLPFEFSDMENAYVVSLQAHCYSVSYYANSFDVNNIKANQARAAFLINQADLNAVIEKYQYDKAYYDALNKGVVYRCYFDKIEQIKRVGNGVEYDVVFSSTLSIIDNTRTTKFKIISKATAINTTHRWPENPTGFYFKNYIQEYYPIQE